MAIQGIYVKLAVDYADDPKVAALARFGSPDAGLARDLFVAMICYSKRMLTDGFVPVEQIARLVFPVSQADGEQLAKQLAQVGLIREEANAEQHGYLVLAYCKRNGTKKSTEELQAKRAAAGRIGGRSRRSKPQRKQSAKQNQAQTESKTETEAAAENPSAAAARDARATRARARDTDHDKTQPDDDGQTPDDNQTPDDDDPSITAVITTLTAKFGHPPSPGNAARMTAAILAGRTPRDPAAYAAAAIRGEPDPYARWLPAHPPPPPPPRTPTTAGVPQPRATPGHVRKVAAELRAAMGWTPPPEPAGDSTQLRALPAPSDSDEELPF